MTAANPATLSPSSRELMTELQSVGLRLVDRSLVRFAEGGETGQGFFEILVGAQCEGIDAATLHEEELVEQHVADGADFALITVALAQQTGARIAAAIGEFREVDADHGQATEVGGKRCRIFVAVEPDADRRTLRNDFRLARQPYGEWYEQGAGG